MLLAAEKQGRVALHRLPLDAFQHLQLATTTQLDSFFASGGARSPVRKTAVAVHLA